jgi:hypothetical protein
MASNAIKTDNLVEMALKSFLSKIISKNIGQGAKIHPIKKVDEVISPNLMIMIIIH